jgi:hypothetical protein
VRFRRWLLPSSCKAGKSGEVWSQNDSRAHFTDDSQLGGMSRVSKKSKF